MATAAKTRMLTIGTVCGMLKDDFPDISISKIRYLEDEFRHMVEEIMESESAAAKI